LRRRRRFVDPPALGAFVILAASAAVAAEPDKSGYHLFNPTPRDQMREMSTDRPDKTESPYTVDAGHFQVESEVNLARDRDTSGGADTRADAWAVGPVNLKVGLFNDVDLQVILEPWIHLRTEDRIAGITTHQSGFGDITVRLKKNFVGNDGGRTAFGMMPYVKLPTNQDDLGNDAVEGGVIVPLAVQLPCDVSMGVMTQVDFLRNDLNLGYHAAFVNTITFGRDIVGNLAGYVEFFSEVSTEDNEDWVGTFDFGFTYALTEDLQLDAGLNVGVTDPALDWNPFLGISWRY
jgi:hypothetical protein